MKKRTKRILAEIAVVLVLIIIIDTAQYIPAFTRMAKESYGWPDSEIQPTYQNLIYGTQEGIPLFLDIYLPDEQVECDEDFPLIVFTHGGGWMNGNKGIVEPGALRLLDEGYAIASIGYSLSDEAKWPVQGQQVKGAVRWLRANADEYDLDTDRFISYGGSAGGHLSSFLGTTNGVSEFDVAAYGNMDYSSDVQASVALYPITNLLQEKPFSVLNSTLMNPNAGHSEFTKLLGGKIKDNEDLAKNASPYYHVSKETTVPMLLMHGTDDKIVSVEHSRGLYEVLQSNGVPSEFYENEDYTHVDIEYANDEITAIVLDFISDHVN